MPNPIPPGDLEEALTRAVFDRHRAVAPDVERWIRPTPAAELELLVVQDLVDGRRLTVRWWPDGLAFVLDDGKAFRAVLDLAAAARLGAAISGRLDEWRNR